MFPFYSCKARYCLVAVAAMACWHRSDAGRADAPVRVVPQVGWTGSGRISDDGKLAVAWPCREDRVRLIAMDGPELLWSIPLVEAADAAFSPDGRWLVACGQDAGVLLDLRSADLREIEAFRGHFIRFTRDSRHVIVVRDGLFVYDRAGKQLARYELGMAMVRKLEVLPDGKTVRLIGVHGRPASRAIKDVVPAELTVNLQAGTSDVKLGPIDRDRYPVTPADSTVVELPKSAGRPPSRWADMLFWDDASGICVQWSKRGSTLLSWDLRAGRFLAQRVEVSEPAGFVGPATFLANTVQGREWRVSFINARTGEVTQSHLPWAIMWPSPAGDRFAAAFGEKWWTEGWVGLFAIPPDEPLYRDEYEKRFWHAAWSACGTWFVRSTVPTEHPLLHVTRASDGRFRTIPLRDLPGDDRQRVWSVDVEGAVGRVAAGLGTAESGLVAVYDVESGERQLMLQGFSVWVSALRFLGPHRLLTGSQRGRVQLWDLNDRKPLWTTETEGDGVNAFDHVQGGPYVVCTHLFRSATVIGLDDGSIVRPTERRALLSDTTAPSKGSYPGIHPLLVADGTLALELTTDSTELHLVNAASGESMAVFCVLPDNQWIVHTPDGAWDGSQQAHGHVHFYRGLVRLTEAEAERHRSRPRIDAALRRLR